MDTWLVTGSSGFLGTNAGLWLEGRVHRVGLARRKADLAPFDEQWAVDLRDPEAAAECVRSVRPQVVLHAAAMSGHETCAHDPEQARAVNVVATRAIAEAASDVGARIVYISTDAVFSGADGNYRESDETSPFSLYGETKLAGERVVLDSETRSLIVRTNFFGWSASGRRSVLEFFVNSLRAGKEVKGYPDFVVTSMYVQSLVETIWRLMEMDVEGLVHVASSDAVSKHDFGVAVADAFGLDAGLISPEYSAAGGHATSRSRDISLNTELLTSMLGSPPATQADGIRQAYLDEPTLGSALRSLENAP